MRMITDLRGYRESHWAILCLLSQAVFYSSSRLIASSAGSLISIGSN